MNITIEAIEKVMNQAGVDYAAAKEALIKTDGNADEAIKLLQPKVFELEEDTKKLFDKVKSIINEGNVDKVQVKRGDDVIISVPVNIGILGGIVGFATIPGALIVACAAAFGLGCRLEVVKKDGTTNVVK